VSKQVSKKIQKHAQISTGCGAKPNVTPPAAPLTTGVTKVSSVDKNLQKLVAMATSLEVRKTNFRLIICISISTSPTNLAKIGPVDFEIICLTKIVKNKKQKQNI